MSIKERLKYGSNRLTCLTDLLEIVILYSCFHHDPIYADDMHYFKYSVQVRIDEDLIKPSLIELKKNLRKLGWYKYFDINFGFLQKRWPNETFIELVLKPEYESTADDLFTLFKLKYL